MAKNRWRGSADCKAKRIAFENTWGLRIRSCSSKSDEIKKALAVLQEAKKHGIKTTKTEEDIKRMSSIELAGFRKQTRNQIDRKIQDLKYS